MGTHPIFESDFDCLTGKKMFPGRWNLKTLDEVQTVEVDPVSRERRHKDYPKLWTIPEGDAMTILEGFERGLKIAGESGPFIGIPQKDDKGLVTSYKYRTYGEVQADAKKCAIALSKKGLEAGKDFIGFFSKNNYAYDVGILGGYYINIPNVSLYDTLGEQAVHHICNETEVKLIFVEDIKHLELLFKGAAHLKTAVLLGAEHGNIPKKDGVEVITWDAFMKSGENGELKEVRPTAEQLATLNYTSGTTGNPKGVMLTHHQLMISGMGVGEFFLCGQPMSKDDLWFSYLPLAHIFERVAHITFMSYGAQWCYSGGNVAHVVAELAIAKPTVFGAVPRVLNKLYDKINAKLNAPGCISSIKSSLLHLAMSKKRTGYLDAGIVTKDTFWDRKLLATPQALLGGRVHTIACGAAPLNPSVRGFVRELFSVYFVEGYGQTENAAAGCGTIFANYTKEDGCIGVPAPWTGVKLVDVPEMNYFAKDGKGEICFRGGNVMKGYFKLPQKTAETIDSEGWLHTGDIGAWSENGQLKIIDRKKNIFKLSQGEYIAPERLEGIYAKNKLVQQIFIHGNSNESCLVAVVVPNEEEFKAIGSSVPALMKAMNDEAKATDHLKGFEMIRGIHIEHTLFSVENGLLTPTQKAKRPQLLAKYKTALDQLYADMKH